MIKRSSITGILYSISCLLFIAAIIVDIIHNGWYSGNIISLILLIIPITISGIPGILSAFKEKEIRLLFNTTEAYEDAKTHGLFLIVGFLAIIIFVAVFISILSIYSYCIMVLSILLIVIGILIYNEAPEGARTND